jgi:hypothetical protein
MYNVQFLPYSGRSEAWLQLIYLQLRLGIYDFLIASAPFPKGCEKVKATALQNNILTTTFSEGNKITDCAAKSVIFAPGNYRFFYKIMATDYTKCGVNNDFFRCFGEIHGKL